MEQIDEKITMRKSLGGNVSLCLCPLAGFPPYFFGFPSKYYWISSGIRNNDDEKIAGGKRLSLFVAVVGLLLPRAAAVLPPVTY